jgi:hypothetical protein
VRVVRRRCREERGVPRVVCVAGGRGLLGEAVDAEHRVGVGHQAAAAASIGRGAAATNIVNARIRRALRAQRGEPWLHAGQLASLPARVVAAPEGQRHPTVGARCRGRLPAVGHGGVVVHRNRHRERLLRVAWCCACGGSCPDATATATATACLLLLLLMQRGAAARVREEHASRPSARGAERLRIAAVAANPPEARLVAARCATHAATYRRGHARVAVHVLHVCVERGRVRAHCVRVVRRRCREERGVPRVVCVAGGRGLLGEAVGGEHRVGVGHQAAAANIVDVRV